MPIKHLLIIYFIQFLLLALPGYGIAQLLKKAGRTDWKKGFIPFVNTWEMQKMTGRKMHWVFWQLIPIVGWFITPGIYIEFVKLFGRFGIGDHTAASLVAPAYFPYIANKKDVRYIGADIVKKQRKGWLREWFDAAIFAVVAATLIRTFVFEAFVIPTGSMEKTMLVNDYLFVSKMSYGTRVPNTPLSFPFVHHTMPLSTAKSYLEWIKLPYVRWWAQPVKRNDIVVFNFPAGDTVINAAGFQSEITYYDVVNQFIGKQNLQPGAARNAVLDNTQQFPIIKRPTDKKENYVKRCVGVPGDKLQVKQGMLYVNDKPMDYIPNIQLWYDVYLKNKGKINTTYFAEQYGVDYFKTEATGDGQITPHSNKAEIVEKNANAGHYQMLLTNEAKIKLEKSGMLDSIMVEAHDHNPFMFPAYYHFDTQDKFDVNNYGPIVIPGKKFPITLTAENVRMYRRAIETYEGKTIEFANGQYTVDGKNQYTFIYDYYWMMGDNRHNSQDSRFWGYVPETHIVGKPKLIWFSKDKDSGAYRWKRFFSSPK
jgi:signal peptidase I